MELVTLIQTWTMKNSSAEISTSQYCGRHGINECGIMSKDNNRQIVASTLI